MHAYIFVIHTFVTILSINQSEYFPDSILLNVSIF